MQLACNQHGCGCRKKTFCADVERQWVVLAQACESRLIDADWAFCEESLKDTGNDNRAFRQRERRQPN